MQITDILAQMGGFHSMAPEPAKQHGSARVR